MCYDLDVDAFASVICRIPVICGATDLIGNVYSVYALPAQFYTRFRDPSLVENIVNCDAVEERTNNRMFQCMPMHFWLMLLLLYGYQCVCLLLLCSSAYQVFDSIFYANNFMEN